MSRSNPMRSASGDTAGRPRSEANLPLVVAAPADSAALQARITELEAENERLRQQVKALQELLAE